MSQKSEFNEKFSHWRAQKIFFFFNESDRLRGKLGNIDFPEFIYIFRLFVWVRIFYVGYMLCEGEFNVSSRWLSTWQHMNSSSCSILLPRLGSFNIIYAMLMLYVACFCFLGVEKMKRKENLDKNFLFSLAVNVDGRWLRLGAVGIFNRLISHHTQISARLEYYTVNCKFSEICETTLDCCEMSEVVWCVVLCEKCFSSRKGFFLLFKVGWDSRLRLHAIWVQEKVEEALKLKSSKFIAVCLGLEVSQLSQQQTTARQSGMRNRFIYIFFWPVYAAFDTILLRLPRHFHCT